VVCIRQRVKNVETDGLIDRTFSSYHHSTVVSKMQCKSKLNGKEKGLDCFEWYTIEQITSYPS
jgi:hypothetical protein